MYTLYKTEVSFLQNTHALCSDKAAVIIRDSPVALCLHLLYLVLFMHINIL